MLETVLNIGLNKSVCEKIAAANGGANKRFAYDAYRRLLDMFGSVVFEMDRSQFEMELERVKEKKGVEKDTELSAEDLMEVCDAYEQVYLKVDPNRPFPSEPTKQLKLAIEAVFESWNKPRAKVYREIAGLSSLGGTAVNVQSMVFGNLGETSGTGVCFTRRPDTGEKIIFGEYLINAQRRRRRRGIRTPEPISTLFEKMPVVAQSLQDTLDKLEMHFKNMQDIEFTIDSGKLFILQTRNGKRNGVAAINVAVDMYEEGLITKKEAIEMVELDHLNQLIHPAFKETEEDYIDAKISTGLAASPGCAVGRVAFSSEDVLEMKKANPKEGVIFVPRRDICRRCFRHARVQWFLDAKWWDDVARCRRRSRMGLTVRFRCRNHASGRGEERGVFLQQRKHLSRELNRYSKVRRLDFFGWR